MHAREFFGAILRANAKDRDFRRRSAANVRCRFPPTGGLFFRPLSHMQLCPPQPNSPPDTVIRAARPDFLIGACFKPCTTTHVRRAASRAQITASGMTGPGGPHRRASVGRDTTPCFRYRGALAPDGYVFALPTEWASTSSSIARMPPARAGNADIRDNLVSSTVSTLRSSVMRRVVASGQLECVCPWRLAPSEPRIAAGASVTADREGSVTPPPPMRAHSLASLSSTGTRPSWVMQAPF